MQARCNNQRAKIYTGVSQEYGRKGARLWKKLAASGNNTRGRNKEMAKTQLRIQAQQHFFLKVQKFSTKI